MPDAAEPRGSYRKTVWLALGGSAALAAAAVAAALSIGGPAGGGAAVVLALAAAGLATIAAGGFLCLYRDRRESSGKPDLVYVASNRPPRRWPRFRLGYDLRPGDVVRVRSADAILATLDDRGTLENLPFMPEMLPCCGRLFRVHRRVDKIHDMILKTGLRRMHGVVTLRDVRCDGSGHDGCQAECHILWKDRWLEPVTEREAAENPERGNLPTTADEHALRRLQALAIRSDPRGATCYTCQITEMRRASHAMWPFDVRQDLRPLLAGNIGIAGFLVVVLTWAFNVVQRARGGCDYPYGPPNTADGRTPRRDLALRPGELVRVKDKVEIGRTLVDNRNRGLWFDREMVRFCNQVFTVRARVDRLVDERSGAMLTMKTPCIVLDKVTATGEFLRFCPQNETIYWREIWLERAGSEAEEPEEPAMLAR